MLWSHYEEIRELTGERDNARNNVRCTQARKTTHGLDGQRQYKDRTPHRKVSQNDRQQEVNGESTSMVWPTLGSRTAKEQIACMQCMRCGRLLQMSHLAWSVCW